MLPSVFVPTMAVLADTTMKSLAPWRSGPCDISRPRLWLRVTKIRTSGHQAQLPADRRLASLFWKWTGPGLLLREWTQMGTTGAWAWGGRSLEWHRGPDRREEG
jgi:hypothetical protein